ncbi:MULTISPECIES: hypothetical protein [Serratia]|uniref:hypothetical protein n=1 Tax=Serratia TaxID=613 RepID=UPI00217ADE74|nr:MULTISPECIES: hypothetical protein [Serratia]CAI1005478.1 Uncharacterised protein [Serratia quinivorans]CAI1091521.1 Uncharacterised protein [Serratia quinivorans]CAI2121278.1 Uncharacterised protein [Serratia quinivorans]CAI2488120.1 Uncharacterised protein [Serratia liquefaciens]
MSFARYRLCVTVLMALVACAARASDALTMTFSASVSQSTCDMRFSQGDGDMSRVVHEISLGTFTRADFTSNTVRLAGDNALMMYFPEQSCAGRNLRVKVDGPAARGAKGRSWGDPHRSLAWGMRLKWSENGLSGRYPLTPRDNTVNLTVPSARVQRAGNAVHGLVFRPELRTWDYRRIVAGTSLSMPLVFSVIYD